MRIQEQQDEILAGTEDHSENECASCAEGHEYVCQECKDWWGFETVEEINEWKRTQP